MAYAIYYGALYALPRTRYRWTAGSLRHGPIPLWLLARWALVYDLDLGRIRELATGRIALPARVAQDRTWHPWPAHMPFADEVDRWWPSEEYPPLAPPPVVEDALPDRPPAVVLWPAAGGLLDTWV